jgi:septum formation protein
VWRRLVAGRRILTDWTDGGAFQSCYMSRVLVLASASPRRLELLRSAGYDPVVDPADVPEIPDPALSPADNAAGFAWSKAQVVAARRPGAVVLAADTIVVVDDRLLGKPKDADEAREMLRSLDDRSHNVITCVALLPPAGAAWPAVAFAVSTEVVFRRVSDEEREAYVASREWADKAGGYAIQGGAAGFVRGIAGSYTNVVGLPLAEVVEHLTSVGLRPAFAGVFASREAK